MSIIKPFFIVLTFIWFGVTFGGGIMVITSKKLWSPNHTPFVERLDFQVVAGSLMLIGGILGAILFLAPVLFS